MAERCLAASFPHETPLAEAAPLVHVAGVTVVRGGHRILDAVDLAVSDGEIVSLIGPNGAGKTTLIRIVLDLVRPDAGTVTRRRGLRVGYVPQRWAVDPVMPLTVRRLMRLTDRPDEASIRAALCETGVERLLDQPVDTLSGGELQRVLLARALVRSPGLLVLDEPVQGVDFAGEAALYELIGRLRDRRGCAILIVSHDLHMVMGATDRVVCLNRHVCCAGAPDAVSRDPAFRSLLGPRAEAYAVYRHHHDHAHALDGGVVSGPGSAPVG